LHLKNREAKIPLTAKRREYIIDIDMNDYDGIRTCCEGKKLCNSCWKYMEAAYKVLREVLYEIFGFQKILWVFSGRRGMHAWVCDQEAMGLESMERKSITNYLNVTVNNEKSDRLVVPESLAKYNSVRLFQLCEKILLPYEKFLFEEQNFLGHPTRKEGNYKRIISVLKRHLKENGFSYEEKTYEDFTANLRNNNAVDPNLSMKIFEKILNTYGGILNSQQTKSNIVQNTDELVRKFKFEIIVGFLYPKIDSAVSSHTNHLLKAPFNIHSSSLLLSVPVDPENFDINNIPSLQDITSGKASIAHYINNFRDFVNDLKNSTSRSINKKTNVIGQLAKPNSQKVH
jgi:DNA primase small subunit